MSKTLIFVHGFHLQADNWHAVVWGEPQRGVYGRVPRAIQIAGGREGVVLCIGSGGSVQNGLTEAEVSLAQLHAQYEDIPESVWGMAHANVRAYLERVVLLQKVATTTAEEVQVAMNLCIGEDISEVILVSSPTHISRCLLDAEKLRTKPQFAHVRVWATASDVSYAGYGPGDVVVVEPPHRGDMPQVEFHKNAKNILQLMRSEKVATGFNDAWRSLIEHWRLKLPK